MSKKASKKARQMVTLIITVISLVCAVLFIPWEAVSLRLTPLSTSIEEELVLGTEYGIDGLMVYVDQAGEEAVYTAGWKDRDLRIPADADGYFKIASISKLYIAVVTTKLIDEKILSLDATLDELLPDISSRIEYSDQVTLKLLLQHRSGIMDFIDHPDFPWENPPTTNEESLEFILDSKGDFQPDKKYSYSNTNYLLIGAILDDVLGYSHHQFILDEILEPHGLDHTFNLMADVDINDMISGYYVGYDQDIKYNDFIMPGGSMVATIQDVGRFLRLLNNGDLFTSSQQEIYSSVYEYEHTGELPGYLSIARYHKDTDTVIILFANTSGSDSWSKVTKVYDRVRKIANQ